jgi:RES domain-containing protein
LPAAWRIVKRGFAGSAFDGEGARLNGGRWNSVGTPLVYLSSSQALAVLEILVQRHDEDSLRAGYVLFEVTYQARHRHDVVIADLPRDWRASPFGPGVSAVGDRWYAAQSSLLLGVPSAVLPEEMNLLMNPHHPAASELRISAARTLSIDPRLLGRS